MLDRIIKLSVDFRIAVLIATLGVAAVGIGFLLGISRR